MVSSAVILAISLLTSTQSLFSFTVSEADLYFCEKAGREAIRQMAVRRKSTFFFIIIFKRVIRDVLAYSGVIALIRRNYKLICCMPTIMPRIDYCLNKKKYFKDASTVSSLCLQTRIAYYLWKCLALTSHGPPFIQSCLVCVETRGLYHPVHY